MRTDSSLIAQNIKIVRERMAAAAIRVGRNPDEIRLIAVSKTKPKDMILKAYEAGQFEFGENYIQELHEKQESRELSGLAEISWHMIGHVQTNKVKKIVGKTTLIHSLDSLRLADAIQKCAKSEGITVNALLEVNVAKEEQKYGFLTNDIYNAAIEMAKYPNIHVVGLMTSAPLTVYPEENRRYFHELHELYLDIGRLKIHNIDMRVLSMGMSGDFEVAIEEGATIVRVGTLLFGSRGFKNTSA